MLARQLLVEMSHIEIRVFFLIQTQHSLGLLHRNPFRTRMPPPIEQPGISISFQTSSPSPHRPNVNTQNLRRLPPCDPLGHCAHYHFLHFHCLLHCSFRVLPLHHVTSVVQSLPSAA